MVLTLEVVGQQASQLGASVRKVFSRCGGTIGRLPENDWALPDPYISSKHARIDYRDGKYFLIDTSTNGVFVNSTDNRLPRSQPHLLNHGDRFFIDAYEIRVTLIGEASSAASSPLSDLFGSNAVPVGAATPKINAGINVGSNNLNQSPRSGEDPFAVTDPFGLAPASAAARPIIPDAAGLSGARVDPFADMDLSGGETLGSSETDPLKLLGLEGKRVIADVPRAADLARHSPLSDHYVPPAAIPAIKPLPDSISSSTASASAIPDDYDPLSDGLSPPSVKPHPVRQETRAPVAPPIKPPIPQPPPETPPIRPRVATPIAEPPVSGDSTAALRPVPGGSRAANGSARSPSSPVTIEPPPVKSAATSMAAKASEGQNPNDLTALLTGAGLSEAQVTPELIENFGRILRVVVGGLMDVLRARERIKDEFRMRMTTFKAVDNNPLKFSANVDDALHNLLVKRNAAYLGPVEAFEDGFQDVRNHQMAMLAGVRVAFDAMLNEFDPERLREQFDPRVKKSSLLSGSAKQQYWELYADKFRAMVSDPESAFSDLFGEAFARAYGEQLERLKAMDRANKKDS